MMKKIAVIGANNRDRMVLTQALSYITGYSVVSKTDYSIQAIRYGLNRELKNAPWQDLFVYVLASFSERIIIEQHYDQYVSNGSVLYELAAVKAHLNMQAAGRRKFKEQTAMLAGVEKIITEYANRQYHGFVYLDNHSEKENALSSEVDNCIKSLMAERESVYHVRKDSILSDMLEKISMNMKIRPVVSSKTALKKAQEDFLK
jgi:hypothetical protein